MSGAQYQQHNGQSGMIVSSPAQQRGAGQATQVEQSRAIAEVQAAVVVAQNRPRSSSLAMQEMREVCRIPALADRAFFRFSRGGAQVNGESVHLARELARVWGNVTYGIAEMARDDGRGQSEMLAFAWDLQTNARSQTTFIVPHVRDTKHGPKPMTDMRDIYENNANMGARRLREMIFAVLPVWFREEAADICRQTLEDGGGKPLVQRIADCLTALQGIGITRAQIEAKIGCPADEMLAEHVASLGVVYKSIKRGEIQREEEFPREEPAAPALPKPASKLDALEQATAPIEQPQAQQVDDAHAAPPSADPKMVAWVEDRVADFAKVKTTKAMFALIDTTRENREFLAREHPELEAKIVAASAAASARLMPKTETPADLPDIEIPGERYLAAG